MDRLLGGAVNHVSLEITGWNRLLTLVQTDDGRHIQASEAAGLIEAFCQDGCEWLVVTQGGDYPSGEMLHMLQCTGASMPGFFSLRRHACDISEAMACEFGVQIPEMLVEELEVAAICISVSAVSKNKRKKLRLQPTVEAVWQLTDGHVKISPWKAITERLESVLFHSGRRCAVVCTEALAGRLENLGFIAIVPENGLTSLTLLPAELEQLCFCRPMTIDLCAALLHFLSTKPTLQLELAGFFYDLAAWPENCFVISTLINPPVQVDTLGFWTNLQTKTTFSRQPHQSALEPLVFGQNLSSCPGGAGIAIIGAARDNFDHLISTLLGLRLKCPHDTILLVDVASECEQVLLACVRMNIRYRNVQRTGDQNSVAASFFHACNTLESGDWTVICLSDPVSINVAGLLSRPACTDAVMTIAPEAAKKKILAMTVGLVAAGVVDAADVSEALRTTIVSSCVFRAVISPELTSRWLKLLGDAWIIGNQGFELASAIITVTAFMCGQKIEIIRSETLPAISIPAMVRRFRPSLAQGPRQLPILALLGQSPAQITNRISAWNWGRETNLVVLIEQSRIRLAKRLIRDWSPCNASIVGIPGKKKRQYKVNLDSLTQERSPEAIVCVIDSQLEPSPGAVLGMKMPRSDCSGLLPRGCGPIFLRASCQSDLVFEADGRISKVNIANGSFDHYDARKFGWQEAGE